MKFALIVSAVCLVATVRGDVLLEDHFDNNDLPSATQFNGGYYTQGGGNGAVVESGTAARLSSSSNQNDFYGMLSSNSVASSAISPSTPVRTTWTISNSDLKAKTSSVIFTWQTSDTLTTAPEFGILLSQDAGEWTLNMFSGTTNDILDFVELGTSFGDDGDLFALSATFTESGFQVYGTEALLKGGGSDSVPLLEDLWDAPLSNSEDYRAGVFVQANGSDGLVIDVDSISIEAIPEPAAVGLIVLSGCGLLFSRRIFGG